MISVSISINGNCIMARSAVNTGKYEGKKCKYRVDDGNEILHDPNDGAVELSKKMLDCIKEVKK